MDGVAHWQTLARYNRIANERLYSACAQLDDVEYRQPRNGSFGSIHGLLNHVLLGDRIWMARFEGVGATTPPLNTILFQEFATLRRARSEEDARIEKFFAQTPEGFFGRPMSYSNNQGRAVIDEPMVAVAHFFNHQTHHRGQVHVFLSQTGVAPPALDLHRIIHPV